MGWVGKEECVLEGGGGGLRHNVWFSIILLFSEKLKATSCITKRAD